MKEIQININQQNNNNNNNNNKIFSALIQFGHLLRIFTEELNVALRKNNVPPFYAVFTSDALCLTAIVRYKLR